jgi:hypothetical protein
MLCVLNRTLVILNGARRCQSWRTCRLLLSATTSIENNMPKVWIPDEGLISSPHPESSRLLPTSPVRRVRDVSAMVIRVPTVVALVMFLRFIVLSSPVTVLQAITVNPGYTFACFLRYITNASTATAKIPATILTIVVVSIGCFLLSSHLL